MERVGNIRALLRHPGKCLPRPKRGALCAVDLMATAVVTKSSSGKRFRSLLNSTFRVSLFGSSAIARLGNFYPVQLIAALPRRTW
jgi:hypothetical protein